MKSKFSWIAVLPSLVIPICFGLIMYLGLSLLIEREVITSEWLIRYLTGHPVSKFTVGMFFVGVSSLLMISWNVWQQFRWETEIGLEASDDFGVSEDSDAIQPAIERRDSNSDPSVERATAILELLAEKNIVVDELNRPGATADKKADVVFTQPPAQKPAFSDLEKDVHENIAQNDLLTTHQVTDAAVDLARGLLDMPRKIHDHYLWRRLYQALGFVHRTGSAHAIEDELKYLSDIDGERQQQRYSLVRILIWATPMLGFLGTVLGISQALGGINVGADNDFQLMMSGLSSSLYIAFDTTALALVLSMGLMFCQFVVDRFETQLLGLVDVRAKSEIAEHFDLSQQIDPGARSMEKIGRAVLEATHDVVHKQTELWRKSIQAAEQAWVESLTGANDRVQNSLGTAVDESVGTLASYMSQAIERADVSMAHRWQQWQVSLSDNARVMEKHQDELIRQSKNIQSLLSDLGHADAFKNAMEQNKGALQATTKLNETLQHLSTSIHKLEEQMDENSIGAAIGKMDERLMENSLSTATLLDDMSKRMESMAQVNAETHLVADDTTQGAHELKVVSGDDEDSSVEPVYEPKTLQIPDFDESSILKFIDKDESKRRAA